MHKMFRCDNKKLSRGFDKIMLAVNIPSLTAIAALSIIYLLIIKRVSVPDDFFRLFITCFFFTCAYSFAVSVIVAVIANLRLTGHRKYTYIEIAGEQLVISRYVYTSSGDRGLTDFRRLWVMNLSDVEQVTCTRSRIIIQGKGRFFEAPAEWLDYSAGNSGKIDFDYWWYDEYGGSEVSSASFPDSFFYAENIAQRIILHSERQKKREIRKSEFRKRMLEIAAQRRTRKKPKERVFRGYEIERNF
ncbi:MAG: hypothetical protein J6K92_00350 [Oscillospiraceae bacterium]|nr:hypothetical protein [Oscillospiraceae bacterium]